MKIGLMNDSFPPTIDGVSTAVFNYANILNDKFKSDVMVITPRAPFVKDRYPYEVFRYDAFQFNHKEKYQFGWPFRHALRKYVRSRQMDILHFHCPIASGKFARIITEEQRIPIVATYHTKYDYDVRKRVPTKALQDFFLRFIVRNISAADEVWVVSPGAGENLRSIGYKGDYIVMPNGVDLTKGKADTATVQSLSEKYKLPKDVPVFLFVGRILWYKNLKLTLDALKMLKESGQDFRFLIVGEGTDHRAVERYARKIGLRNKVIFAGRCADRSVLKGYYSLADAFLFPSAFDTNGLVVREAAACDCPAVLIQGHSAADGIVHGENGYLAESETAESYYRTIHEMLKNREGMKRAGKNAAETLYLSWEDAVAIAYKRYENLCRSWKYPPEYHK